VFGNPLDVHELENGIPLPIHSEYVLQGRLLKEQTKEGPFVDITGTYDMVRDQPVLEIDKIFHRNNPIFQALLPGSLEHYLLMGLPREPVIAHEVSSAGIEVKGVRLTEGGCCWLHGVVSIRKKSEDDGKRAMEAAFKGHRSMKRVVIVDDDVDIFDDRAVEWALATRFQADIGQVVKEERGSSLDPSRKEGDVTAKVGLDATKPLGGGAEFDRVL
jgi:UbiD family decarboxylase